MLRLRGGDNGYCDPDLLRHHRLDGANRGRDDCVEVAVDPAHRRSGVAGVECNIRVEDVVPLAVNPLYILVLSRSAT